VSDILDDLTAWSARPVTHRPAPTNIDAFALLASAVEIHRLRASGLSQARIARQFGIAQNTVSRLVRHDPTVAIKGDP
jgi:hypothetical protein